MIKLILLILITFLCVGNLAHAGISDKERKKFDEGLSRIERQKSNYKKDKEVKRQRELRKTQAKRAKARRQRELKNVMTKRNNRLTLEKKERDTEFNKRNSRNGCYLDEVIGTLKCK